MNLTKRFSFSTLLSVVLLAILSLQTQLVRAEGNLTILYVAPTPIGLDSSPCLSPAAPCTLLKALSFNRDVPKQINFAPGTYPGGLLHTNLPSSPLLLRGQNAETTFIDGGRRVRVITMDPHTDLTIEGITIQNGFVQNTNAGGILVPTSARLTMSNARVINNYVRATDGAAASGGGLFNQGTLTLNNVEISGNEVITTESDSHIGGGGLSNMGDTANAIITNSTIHHNSARVQVGNSSVRGGGILNAYRAQLHLGNVTLVENRAIGDGRMGSYTSGLFGNGGGLGNDSGAVTYMSHATITDNYARAGAGISNGAGDTSCSMTSDVEYLSCSQRNNYGSGQIHIMNSILAHNLRHITGIGLNCDFAITSGGNNISDDGSCTSFRSELHDRLRLNPLLGDLEPNGSRPPLPTSPAIDGVVESGTESPYFAADSSISPMTFLWDQRGYRRSTPPDIGAVETTSMLSAFPSSLTYYLGETRKPLVITNNGTVAFQFEGINITGTNADQFAINDSTCTAATLLPRNACVITINHFNPTITTPVGAYLNIRGTYPVAPIPIVGNMPRGSGGSSGSGGSVGTGGTSGSRGTSSAFADISSLGVMAPVAGASSLLVGSSLTPTAPAISSTLPIITPSLPPDYNVTFIPSTVSVAPGRSSSARAVVTPLNGFRESVDYIYRGLAGVDIRQGADSSNPYEKIYNIIVSPSAVLGIYRVEFYASSTSNIAHTATLNLTIASDASRPSKSSGLAGTSGTAGESGGKMVEMHLIEESDDKSSDPREPVRDSVRKSDKELEGESIEDSEKTDGYSEEKDNAKAPAEEIVGSGGSHGMYLVIGTAGTSEEPAAAPEESDKHLMAAPTADSGEKVAESAGEPTKDATEQLKESLKEDTGPVIQLLTIEGGEAALASLTALGGSTGTTPLNIGIIQGDASHPPEAADVSTESSDDISNNANAVSCTLIR